MNARTLIDLGETILTALGSGWVPGLVLAALVAIGLRVMRSLNATTRYAILFTALVTMALLPALSLVSGWRGDSRGESSATEREGLAARGSQLADVSAEAPSHDQASKETLEEISTVEAEDATHEPEGTWNGEWRIGKRRRDAGAPGFVAREPFPSKLGASHIEPRLPSESEDPAVASAFDDDSTDAPAAAALAGYENGDRGGDASDDRSRDESTPPVDSDQETEAAGRSWLRGVLSRGSDLAGDFRAWIAAPKIRRIDLAGRVSAGLAGLWLVIAMARLAGLGRQMAALRRIKREAQEAPAAWNSALQALAIDLGVRRPVRLGLTDELAAPVAAGFLHPRILLPTAMADLTAEQVEPVLRHELAHLARRDDWTNLVQQAVRAAYFHHPGVLWLSRRLTLEREIACDDHVLSATGRARDYALFLTEFARRNHGRSWTAAPAAWSNPSQLKERIHMLLDSKRNASPRLARGGTGAGIAAVLLAAVLGMQAAPRLAFADSAKTDETTTASASGAASVSASTADGTVSIVTTTPSVDVAPVLAIVDGTGSTTLVSEPTTPPKEKKRTDEGGKTSSLTLHGGPRVTTRIVKVPEGSRVVALAEVAEVPPVPPTPPAAAAASIPAPAPHPMPVQILGVPKPPRIPDGIEARLDRLEKMVESLVKRSEKGSSSSSGTTQKAAPDFRWGSGASAAWSTDKEKYRKDGDNKPNSDNRWGFEGMSRIMDQVARQVEQATKEAEKAVQEALKSARLRTEAGEPAEERRSALEERRKALDSERRALQKQISRVEAQLGRLDSQLDRAEQVLDIEHDSVEAAHEHANLAAEHERAAARARDAARRLQAQADKFERDAAAAKDAAALAGKDLKPSEDKPKEKHKDKGGEEAPSSGSALKR